MRVILVALLGACLYLAALFLCFIASGALLNTPWPGVCAFAILVGVGVGLDARLRRLPGAGRWAIASVALVAVGLPMYLIMRTTPGGYGAWEGWLQRAAAASQGRAERGDGRAEGTTP